MFCLSCFHAMVARHRFLSTTYLSAIATITEDGTYELVEWPRSNDHSCWADGQQVLIRKAREEMLSKVEQNPLRSAIQIYEEVRNSFTQNMQSEEKVLFLIS